MIVVLEGVDGVGKTTIAKDLVSRFSKAGIVSAYAYAPVSYKELTHSQRKAARKGILVCDREAWVTSNVYRKVLPNHDWSEFPVTEETKPLPNAVRILLHPDNVSSLNVDDYTSEELTQLAEHYVTFSEEAPFPVYIMTREEDLYNSLLLKIKDVLLYSWNTSTKKKELYFHGAFYGLATFVVCQMVYNLLMIIFT